MVRFSKAKVRWNAYVLPLSQRSNNGELGIQINPNRELTVKTVADGCVGDSPPIGISPLLHKGLLKSALSCHSSEEHFVESRNYRANHV